MIDNSAIAHVLLAMMTSTDKRASRVSTDELKAWPHNHVDSIVKL